MGQAKELIESLGAIHNFQRFYYIFVLYDTLSTAIFYISRTDSLIVTKFGTQIALIVQGK